MQQYFLLFTSALLFVCANAQLKAPQTRKVYRVQLPKNDKSLLRVSLMEIRQYLCSLRPEPPTQQHVEWSGLVRLSFAIAE